MIILVNDTVSFLIRHCHLTFDHLSVIAHASSKYKLYNRAQGFCQFVRLQSTHFRY
jgi:hypothetical protein